MVIVITSVTTEKAIPAIGNFIPLAMLHRGQCIFSLYLYNTP